MPSPPQGRCVAGLKSEPRTNRLCSGVDLGAELKMINEQLARLAEGQLGLHADIQEIMARGGGQMKNEPSFCERVGHVPSQPVQQLFSSRCSVIEDQRKQRKQLALEKAFSFAEVFESEKQKAQRRHAVHAITVQVQSKHGACLEMYAIKLDFWLDCVIIGLICANAVFIGISMDHQDDHPAWFAVNLFFSLVFMLELALKLYLHSFAGHFCGANGFSNCFDALLIVSDASQLAIELCFPETSQALANAPSASLFRVVRLSRLARMRRILTAPIFADLVAMMQGVVGGIPTLFWALVLFLICIYVIALFFRESLGRYQREHVLEYFDSVPRSMFTTFRCSFGDCSSSGGVPIFEHVELYYGACYSLIMFCTTIGLFNVISAIFVEATLSAAGALEKERKQARMADEKKMGSALTLIVKRILAISGTKDPEELLRDVEAMADFEFPTSVVDSLIEDPEAKHALHDLEIDPLDCARLSDIFDPDNGGTITIGDVGLGLRALRGDPRRSDVICIDLMIRSLQKSLSAIALPE